MGSGFDCILHCRHSGLQLHPALQAFRPSMAIAPAIASCIAGIPAIHGHQKGGLPSRQPVNDIGEESSHEAAHPCTASWCCRGQ
jgi:hypothetical protein